MCVSQIKQGFSARFSNILEILLLMLMLITRKVQRIPDITHLHILIPIKCHKFKCTDSWLAFLPDTCSHLEATLMSTWENSKCEAQHGTREDYHTQFYLRFTSCGNSGEGQRPLPFNSFHSRALTVSGFKANYI